MKPNQFFEQIAQGQYEAFREYLNTGENGGPVTLLNLFKGVRVIPNQPAFLEHLFEALKANTTLTTLGLAANNIGNDGATAIAHALKTNTTLTTLYLGLNNIGREGAAYIAQALKTNTTLTTLDLYNNDIGPDGKTAILRQIPLESALTHLLFERDGSFQNNTNDIIGTLQQEKEVLDIVYRPLPRPITEAFAQYFTAIENEAAQNLLIDPNNDISRGRAYVKHRSLAIKPAQEAAPNATPASNDSQNNPAKRQRLNPKDR